MEPNAKAFWLDFKTCFLKQKNNCQIYKSWLEPVIPSKIEKRGAKLQLTLQAPSGLHKKWLEDHFLQEGCKIFKSFYGESCQIYLEVTPSLPFPKKPFNSRLSSSQNQSLFFNPDYLFENFIVGKNNALAYEACLAITKTKQAEGNMNPLFIYGPSGLGKTHLLNAIGQESLRRQPQNRVMYLSAERFLNEFISSLKNKQMENFRKKFRKNCQLLLMDDIQILAKGHQVQEEFFHTFNELYNKKTQVVICCDQAPSSLSRLEERIKTRLEGGLMLDINYPDKETRLAILKNKTEKRGLFLSSQSLEKIAQTCKGSVREMEGVLNKIKIMTELQDGKLSLKEVEKILSSLKKDLTSEDIQKKTAKAFHIDLEDLKSPSRKKHVVRARQTAMYLIRRYLKKSLSDISHSFEKKDHTTVLNSLKKVEKLRAEDAEFKRILELLQREIHNCHLI